MTGRLASKGAEQSAPFSPARWALIAFVSIYSLAMMGRLHGSSFERSKFATSSLELPDERISAPLPYTKAELFCLAKTVYGEASGEDRYGKHLVAMVAINRAIDQKKDICSIVRSYKQFTGFWTSTVISSQLEHDAFLESYQTAEGALRNYETAYFQEKRILWFHADYVRPYWARAYSASFTQGKHVFYTKRLSTI